MTKSNKSVLDSSLAVEVTNQWRCCCCIGVDMRPKGAAFVYFQRSKWLIRTHTADSWLEVVELVRFRCRWSMIHDQHESSFVLDIWSRISLFGNGVKHLDRGGSGNLGGVWSGVSRTESLRCHAIVFSCWSQFHVVNIWSSKMVYEIRRESGEERKRKRASLYNLQRLLHNFEIIFR